MNKGPNQELSESQIPSDVDRSTNKPKASILPKRVLQLLERVTAADVRYIKLGKGNLWWPLALKTDTLRLGFREFDFQLAAKGDWEAAKNDYAKKRPHLVPGKVTSATKQVQAFFERPETTLWFTLADGFVWWCFAKSPVKNLFDGDVKKEEQIGARLRKVIGKWRNTDVQAKELRQDSITSKITKVKSFQETICKPDGSEELLRLIRCQPSKEHGQATTVLDNLTRYAGDLLAQLQDDDFELLIELIFSSSGWRRISPVGGIQKFLDMAFILPTTGEMCAVQVKSETTRSTLKEYVEKLMSYSGYSRMFFAYHTPTDRFEASEHVTVWNRQEIAKQLIRAGLVNWLLDRTT